MTGLLADRPSLPDFSSGSGSGRRIAVALSGGVDSAATAALLVSQGWEVIGLTMQLWDPGAALPAAGGRTCCAPEDRHDARRVAQKLGIPFYVLNLEAQFQRAVVDDFITSYAAGHTPNPCIRCNQILKFRLLLDKAMDLGAEFLATGHYARVETVEGVPRLLRGLDPDKDQSYFLFATRLEDLSRIRFPLGGLTKSQTRQLAESFGLHLARKRESQDLCFVPDGDHTAFFARHGSAATSTPGPIVDESGQILGQHQGLGHYTIGQRHGLGVAASYPLYVLAIHPGENRLVVGPAAALMRESLDVAQLHWLDPQPLTAPVSILAQIRHASPPRPAWLIPLEGQCARVEFVAPQRATAPGQACVFYVEDRVMGGGWIR
ncbi:MAG: tRNA 2-thiouridine(34) synthase MnmA [Magnetococcales bacterium]|nr:tRNA 2-thiouridine(34) synthase MnmA [Magnetococcales bacterium]